MHGPGYGYELRAPTDEPSADNRVTCTNTATGAAKGLTNTSHDSGPGARRVIADSACLAHA